MANIVFNQRYSTLQAYDEDCINYLETLGHTVVSLTSSELPSYNYSSTQLLIVGAPDLDNTAHPEASFLSTLELPIICFCRYTSRYTFGMSLGSGITDVTTFTVVDSNHPIVDGFSGDVTIGSLETSHRLHNLTSGTDIIMHNGLDGYAGIAERPVEINTISYKRIHWGYHQIGSLSANGNTLFEQTIYYLTGSIIVFPSTSIASFVGQIPTISIVYPTGRYITLPVDLTSFGVSSPALTITWVATIPETTTLDVETAITGKSGGVPVEPIEADWVSKNDKELLGDLPIDLTDHFLWVRISMSRPTPETSSPELSWLVVYDANDNNEAAIRLLFDGDLHTIPEDGSKLFENMLSNETYAYSVYTLSLKEENFYSYLTEGSFFVGEENIEKTIYVPLIGDATVQSSLAILSFSGLSPVITAEGEPPPPPPPPPPAGEYEVWLKKTNKWVASAEVWVKRSNKWVKV